MASLRETRTGRTLRLVGEHRTGGGGAPVAHAVPLDGGDPLFAVHGILALPSDADPQVTLFRHTWGAWSVERAGARTALVTHLDCVRVGDRTWQFRDAPRRAGKVATPSLPLFAFTFRVTRDGECVGIQAGREGRGIGWLPRDEDYLLLELARHWRADAEAGRRSEACGWVSEDTCRSGAPPRPVPLGRGMLLIRRRLASLGVPEAHDVIERRPQNGILRIGAERITIHEIGRARSSDV